VFLCEQGDLGGGASSRTARLVHGGLHRLVTLDLRGLREALVEQRILLQAAPHVVSPARFVLPHHERQWPRWALRLGLFAYDHVARRNLPAARRVDFESDPSGIALNANFETGFEYSDCIADDARLVVLNAIDARGRGASINPRMRCVVAERDGRAWRLSLESTETGERSTVRARTLVNATGPSSGAVLDHVIHADQRLRPRLVKESHIIVARHGQSGHGYTLPNADGRIVYALPYERDFMIVGTSSVDFDGDPNGAAIEAREIDYLLDVANQYFYRPIEWHDIVRGFSCVTAIHEAGEARRGVTRDHHIAVEPGMMPLITAYGGSLTTHRRLAAQVVDRIVKFT
jgi:glycerol-3-phosphate dehydrogenase